MEKFTGDDAAEMRRDARRFPKFFMTRKHCIAIAFSDPAHFEQCIAPLKATRKKKDDQWRRLSAMSAHDRLAVQQSTPHLWVGGPSAEQDSGFVAAAFREIVRLEKRYKEYVLLRYVIESGPKDEPSLPTMADVSDEAALAALLE